MRSDDIRSVGHELVAEIRSAGRVDVSWLPVLPVRDVLAEVLALPQALSPVEALGVVACHWKVTNAYTDGWMRRVLTNGAAFASFIDRLGVTSIVDVTDRHVARFIKARTARTNKAPALSTQARRRSRVAMLFRTAISLGLATHDPSHGVHVGAASRSGYRNLVDDEVRLCRVFAVGASDSRRGAAGWALGEMGAPPREIPRIHVHHATGNVEQIWSPGTDRIRARLLYPTEWGRKMIRGRIRDLADRRLSGATPLIWTDNRKSPQGGRVSASTLLSSVMHRAGITGVNIGPESLRKWAALEIYQETECDLQVVANRLGMSSLDKTADLIDLNWLVEDDEPPLGP